MSELRVALVAEGPLDLVIIEAALRALLPRPFTLSLLQPEPTRPRLGTGWCGVFKWCREAADRSAASLETDPTLEGFDLFVVHVDADVAEKSYGHGGTAMEKMAAELPVLPVKLPCPPAQDSAEAMRTRIVAWLGMADIGPKTVLCVPSKTTDTWLAAALLDGSHLILQGLECDLNIEAKLVNFPKATRIKKTQRAYETRSHQITSSWDLVRQRCTQAERFSAEVQLACA